jgi:hypothetical protein
MRRRSSFKKLAHLRQRANVGPSLELPGSFVGTSFLAPPRQAFGLNTVEPSVDIFVSLDILRYARLHSSLQLARSGFGGFQHLILLTGKDRKETAGETTDRLPVISAGLFV